MDIGYASFNSLFGSKNFFEDGKIATLFFDNIYFSEVIIDSSEMIFGHLELDEKISYKTKMTLSQHWFASAPTIKLGENYWDGVTTNQQKTLEAALLNSTYNNRKLKRLDLDLWKTGNYILGELINSKKQYPGYNYIGNTIEKQYLNSLLLEIQQFDLIHICQLNFQIFPC